MFSNKRKRLDLATIVLRGPNQQNPADPSEPVFPKQKSISRPFIVLLSIIFSGAVAAYFLYSGDEEGKVVSSTDVIKPKDNAPLQRQEENTSYRDSLLAGIKRSETVQNNAADANANASAYINSNTSAQEQVKNHAPNAVSQPQATPDYSNSYYSNSKYSKKEAKEPAIVKTQYKVLSKAYFYSQPNLKSRKANYIDNWKKFYPPLNALDKKNGFIYVVFTNDDGQTSEGWLRKKDVQPVKSAIYQSDLK